MLKIFSTLFDAVFFLFGLIFTLFVAFWWLIPHHIQAELGLPARAGLYLFFMYIFALNRLPTQGYLLFRQNRFRYIHVPALFVATLGFALGFVLNKA